MDPAALGAIARDDADEGVRAQAVAMLRDIALEAFEGIGEAESLAAVDALDRPEAARHGWRRRASRESVAPRALAAASPTRTCSARLRGRPSTNRSARAAFDRLAAINAKSSPSR